MYLKMLTAAVVLCFMLCYVSTYSWDSESTYVIDTAALGRQYDGIGGLSGGGATSKLLVNYPEKQRNEILDYLFLPNFAASLQILKVEIGGDSQSTDGTESSHMHEPDDENYQRGYEWWLMLEAKKRNPGIKLYGLPWAFPGWIGGYSQDPYVNATRTATYIIKWIKAAQQIYNLTIDYIGIWNERNYNIVYIKTLRKMLNDNGLHNTQMVVADGDWGIADDMLKDPSLMDAVAYIGVHYPGTLTSDNAVLTGKQLWASEDYSTFNDNVGAGCWARILNQNYVNGNMTSTISWNLIAAYYLDLPFGRDGLMTAIEPWSGHYVVESPIWVTAHTTQFTDIGWHYLKHGQGSGHLKGGGSYVTLVSPDGKDFTIVIETMSHDHSECIRPGLPAYNVSVQIASFQLKGNFASITSLNEFYSTLGYNGSPTLLFVDADPLALCVTDGKFEVPLGPDMIVTLTTTKRGHRGHRDDPPPAKPFPLPYYDSFDGYREFEEASNFAPQIGVFEIRKDASRGLVNTQVMLHEAVDWCKQPDRPITLGGNYNWADLIVSVDVNLAMSQPANGSLLAARISQGGCQTKDSTGVFFFIYPSSKTFQVSGDFAKTQVIKEGSLTADVSQWYRQVLGVKGDRLYGSIGGQEVFNIEMRTASKNGFVGYGTDGLGYAAFDNFMISEI